MKHPTDEWMVTGFGSDGKRRRLVIHHDPADLFTDVAMHAVTSAIASWSNPGNSITIVAIVNQEAEDEPPFSVNHYRYHTPAGPNPPCANCRHVNFSQPEEGADDD